MHKILMNTRSLLAMAEEENTPLEEYLPYDPVKRQAEEDSCWEEYFSSRYASGGMETEALPPFDEEIYGDNNSSDFLSDDVASELELFFGSEKKSQVNMLSCKHPPRTRALRRQNSKHHKHSLQRAAKNAFANLAVRRCEDIKNKSFSRKRGGKLVKSRVKRTWDLINRSQKCEPNI